MINFKFLFNFYYFFAFLLASNRFSLSTIASILGNFLINFILLSLWFANFTSNFFIHFCINFLDYLYTSYIFFFLVSLVYLERLEYFQNEVISLYIFFMDSAFSSLKCLFWSFYNYRFAITSYICFLIILTFSMFTFRNITIKSSYAGDLAYSYWIKLV